VTLPAPSIWWMRVPCSRSQVARSASVTCGTQPKADALPSRRSGRVKMRNSDSLTPFDAEKRAATWRVVVTSPLSSTLSDCSPARRTSLLAATLCRAS
jgi:hypothetical protein